MFNKVFKSIIIFVAFIIDKILTKYYFFKIETVASKIGKNLKVSSKSNVNINTIIGDNVTLNGIEVQGMGKVSIGDNCQIARECVLISQNHNIEGGYLPFGKDNILKNITIEENVWIGFRVLILPGVTIGEGAVIQAGSTVINNIPKYAISGGHPARVFKYRDIEYYKELKGKKLFFKDNK